MDLLNNLALGLGTALQPENVLYCLVGVVLGTAVGVLPGIGPTATIAMLLPITFSLEPVAALIMLAGIYYGAQYGGSTTAILINLPGETSAAVTAIDGHEMALKGRAGPALAAAALGSFFAGTVGTVVLAVAAPPWPASRSSSAPRSTSRSSCSGCSHRSRWRRLDPEGPGDDRPGDPAGDGGPGHLHRHSPLRVRGPRAVRRHQLRLRGGRDVRRRRDPPQSRGRADPHRGGGEGEEPVADKEDLRRMVAPVLRATGLGSALGILPGGGHVLAAFASYSVEKRVSKRPQEFGHGAIEGVAGPESANNAAAQTSFIPLLTLGLPAHPVMALMIGAFIIQGITPGPDVITEQPALVWGLIASMWVGNVLLVMLNLPLIGVGEDADDPVPHPLPSDHRVRGHRHVLAGVQPLARVRDRLLRILGYVLIRAAASLRRSCWASSSDPCLRRTSAGADHLSAATPRSSSPGRSRPPSWSSPSVPWLWRCSRRSAGAERSSSRRSCSRRCRPGKAQSAWRLMAPRHLPPGPGGDQRREAPIRGDQRAGGPAQPGLRSRRGSVTAGAADPDRRPGAEAVPPMALPDPGPLPSAASLERFGAVRLFLNRGPGGASRLRRRRPERRRRGRDLPAAGRAPAGHRAGGCSDHHLSSSTPTCGVFASSL